MLRVEGRFADCKKCKGQPKHWVEQTKGGLYQVECCPCGSRTQKFSTHQQAVEAWEAMNVTEVAV